MTNVFYTKKTKNKWRARKRKMEKVSAIGGNADDGDAHYDNDDQRKQSSSRKRTADQISNINGTKHQLEESNSSDVHQTKKVKQQQHEQPISTTITTITIPGNLTSKEAKK